MRRPAPLVLAAALLLAAARPSAAQQDASRDASYREARERVEVGHRYFDAVDPPRAAEEYLAAYELVPLPELLYNLGQCYRLSGDHARAIEYYRRFLGVTPTGAEADKAREHIERLGGRHDDVVPPEAAPPPPAPAPAPPPPAAAVAPATAPPDDRAPSRRRERWLALGLTGVGVVATASGDVLWYSADRTHDRLERDCAPGCDESEWQGARTRERVGLALTATGALAAAA